MTHLNYEQLAVIFPVVAGATPFVVQALKTFLDKYLINNPNHDIIWRGITFVIAAVVGVLALFVSHTNPNNAQDWLVTVLVVGVYGVFGGVSAQGLYSFLNGWLHQSVPITPTPAVPKVGATPVGLPTTTNTDQEPRQQY